MILSVYSGNFNVNIIFLSINNIPAMSMSQFEYSALTENSSDDQSDVSKIIINIS